MVPSCRPTFTVFALLALLRLLAPEPGRGQPPNASGDPAPAAIAAELATLNRTLDRIAGLLESQAESQRLGLVLERVGLESDRIAELEGELRRLESTKRSLEDERFRIQSRIEEVGEEVEIRTDLPPESLRAMERMATDAERMLERLEGQIGDAEARSAEIDNELTRRRADLQSLRDRVDRELRGD